MERLYRKLCKKCRLYFKKSIEKKYKEKYRAKLGVKELEKIRYMEWYKKNCLIISKKKHLYYLRLKNDHR